MASMIAGITEENRLLFEVREMLEGKDRVKCLSELALFIQRKPCWTPGFPLPPYVVDIDPAISFSEMISAGKYDSIDPVITANKRFSIIKSIGKKEREIRLINFNRVISTKEAIKELRKMDLRPVQIEDLLPFGAKFPDVQRRFPVIALGSTYRKMFFFRFVPFLGGNNWLRDLSLHWIGRKWANYCQFAAVPINS